MFKSHSQAQINEAQRKYWLDAKARDKTRFIWRDAIGSILIWLIVLPAVQVFGNRGPLLSLQFGVIWLILLPIFLLGGYLTGSWKWKDLKKVLRIVSVPLDSCRKIIATLTMVLLSLVGLLS